MTSSSADEIPRGVDFLFSLNRINVAVSRAQVLSLVFASPRLLEVPCPNVKEMRLDARFKAEADKRGCHKLSEGHRQVRSCRCEATKRAALTAPAHLGRNRAQREDANSGGRCERRFTRKQPIVRNAVGQ
jgi:hypothetical protein